MQNVSTIRTNHYIRNGEGEVESAEIVLIGQAREVKIGVTQTAESV